MTNRDYGSPDNNQGHSFGSRTFGRENPYLREKNDEKCDGPPKVDWLGALVSRTHKAGKADKRQGPRPCLSRTTNSCKRLNSILQYETWQGNYVRYSNYELLGWEEGDHWIQRYLIKCETSWKETEKLWSHRHLHQPRIPNCTCISWKEWKGTSRSTCLPFGNSPM
jgi:hypothetical protein